MLKIWYPILSSIVNIIERDLCVIQYGLHHLHFDIEQDIHMRSEIGLDLLTISYSEIGARYIRKDF